MKYKVGDLVKIVKAYEGNNSVGCIGTIVESLKSRWEVHCPNMAIGHGDDCRYTRAFHLD